MIYVGFISHFVCQHSVFLFLNLLCCIPLYEYNTIHLYIFLMRNWTSVKSKVKGPILNNGLLLFSCSVVSNSLQHHGLQHTRLPCSSLFPRVCSNSCPLSWWCHPTISSSVIPFSLCPQSFQAPRSFPVSWLFASGGQSTKASASVTVLPMNIHGWFTSGLTSLILKSKGKTYFQLLNYRTLR